MRPQDTAMQTEKAYQLAASFYFLGVYDGALRFDYDTEADAATAGDEVYAQLGRIIADEWKFPEDE